MALLALNTSIAGTNVNPVEIKDVKFWSCGSTNPGRNENLEKFSMSAELENGERVLTNSQDGKQFATCKNIEKGIKCKLSWRKSFVLNYSKLRLRTRLDTNHKYYAIKSIDHVYQCDQY